MVNACLEAAMRIRCCDCSFERLVALSCKGRGFCPVVAEVRANALSAAERAGHFALRPALGFGTHS